MSLEHAPWKLAYSIPEFCKIAGVGRTKAYEELAAGRLKAKKVGSRTLITNAAEWLDSLPDFEPSDRANLESEAA